MAEEQGRGLPRGGRGRVLGEDARVPRRARGGRARGRGLLRLCAEGARPPGAQGQVGRAAHVLHDLRRHHGLQPGALLRHPRDPAGARRGLRLRGGVRREAARGSAPLLRDHLLGPLHRHAHAGGIHLVHLPGRGHCAWLRALFPPRLRGQHRGGPPRLCLHRRRGVLHPGHHGAAGLGPRTHRGHLRHHRRGLLRGLRGPLRPRLRGRSGQEARRARDLRALRGGHLCHGGRHHHAGCLGLPAGHHAQLLLQVWYLHDEHHRLLACGGQRGIRRTPRPLRARERRGRHAHLGQVDHGQG
mmetsp:Transcript_12664/g.38116  ORF Transcript_12664/g.38116 Transcript_12664/m.38116 type:complete len:300 (-) Transcript_12664:551-1450(-)